MRSGEVSCLIREDGMTVAGQGAHSDIVMASALSLVNALNRLRARTPSIEKDAAVRRSSPTFSAGEVVRAAIFCEQSYRG